MTLVGLRSPRRTVLDKYEGIHALIRVLASSPLARARGTRRRLFGPPRSRHRSAAESLSACDRAIAARDWPSSWPPSITTADDAPARARRPPACLQPFEQSTPNEERFTRSRSRPRTRPPLVRRRRASATPARDNAMTQRPPHPLLRSKDRANASISALTIP
jgi:hypothetical protein